MNRIFFILLFNISLSPYVFASNLGCQNSKTKNIPSAHQRLFLDAMYCPHHAELEKDYCFNLTTENGELLSHLLNQINAKSKTLLTNTNFRFIKNKTSFVKFNKQQNCMTVIANDKGAERIYDFIRKYDQPTCLSLRSQTATSKN